MRLEPRVKRAVSFIDGQNLYRHAKDAFGHHHPNYDPIKPSDAVYVASGWTSCGVRFYTGTPAADRSPMWHGYWQRRLLAMRRAGIHVFSRPIRYRTDSIRLPDGSTVTNVVGEEKGIDLRIGLDVVRLAYRAELDVAVIFSQDQDLAEVADEIRTISRTAARWLKVVVGVSGRPASHYPSGYRQNRLVPHRTGSLRRLPRPSRLPATPVSRTTGDVG